MDDVIWWPAGVYESQHTAALQDCMEMENMCFSFDCVMQVFMPLCAWYNDGFLNPFIHLRNIVYFPSCYSEGRLNKDEGGLEPN